MKCISLSIFFSIFFYAQDVLTQVSLRVSEKFDDPLSFEIDTSNWILQDPEIARKAMLSAAKDKSKAQHFKVNAFYTLSKAPVYSFPSITIIESKSPHRIDDIDRVQKEYNGREVSIDEFSEKVIDGNFIKDVNMEQPTIDKLNKVILQTSKVQTVGRGVIIIQQATFLRGRRIVMIQLSYIKGSAPDHCFKDFYGIIHTMN